MLPLARMFPLAVMHTHSLPFFNTILAKKKSEVRRGLDIKNTWTDDLEIETLQFLKAV